jgi:hypothetical protein
LQYNTPVAQSFAAFVKEVKAPSNDREAPQGAQHHASSFLNTLKLAVQDLEVQ